MLANQTTTLELWQRNNAELLFRFGSGILILVGTIGNLIAVITLQSRLFKSSPTSFLLSMLALCDVFVLNTGLMNRWLLYAFKIHVRALTRYGCKIHMLFTYFSHQIASWTLVLLTVERTISVTIPQRCHEFCSRRRIILVWIGLVVVILCCNIHFFLSFDLVNDVEDIKNGSKCDVITPWRTFFYGPWYWIDAFLGDFIPFLVVFVGNVIIIHRVRANNIRFMEMRALKMNKARISSTTCILILVSIVFLVCNVPMDVYFLGYAYGSFQDATSEQDAVRKLVYACVSLLCYSNNAFEFILYFVNGRKFRSAFSDMFGCRNAPCLCLRNKIKTTRSAGISKSWDEENFEHYI